jgi:hypothetical protein
MVIEISPSNMYIVSLWVGACLHHKLQNKLKKLFQDNEDVQSDMDLDLLAESESDSETENEANDARGSAGNVGGGNDGNENRNSEAAGGNAANNDTFFSDDDSGDSSHGDEDESEAGETDEQDGDELTFEAGLSASKSLRLFLLTLVVFFS